jgi:5'-nucleotidase
VAENRQVRVHPQTLPGLDVPAYSVEGHPAFIVHSAAEGWLDPLPEIVLSGINVGANVGASVIHSGTVGAALTAAMHGWPALAASLDCGLRGAPDAHWETVLEVLPEVLELLLTRPGGTVLSLNVPDLPAAELKELREAELSAFGQVQVRVAHTPGTPGTLQTTLLALDEDPKPGSDVALLAAGHPTLTELRSVSAVPGLLG